MRGLFFHGPARCHFALTKKEEHMMMTLEEVKKLAEDKTYGRIPLTTV